MSERVRPLLLVVDDSDAVRDVLKDALESAGFETVLAADGLEALEKFFAYEPDLVILDLVLPHMDGWEVLKRLRAVSDCPIVVITGRWEEEERIRGLEMGADDYVVKPFGMAELVARIHAVLRRSGGDARAGWGTAG